MRDAALTGGMCAPATLLGAIGSAWARTGPDHDPEVFRALSITVGMGALVGAAVGLPAAIAARLAWRVHPVVALVLGPLVGGIGGVVAFDAIAVAFGSPMLRAADFGWISGAGAVALGPPWVGYVAVRSRGRSGLGVVVGTALWAVAVGAATEGLSWLAG